MKNLSNFILEKEAKLSRSIISSNDKEYEKVYNEITRRIDADKNADLNDIDVSKCKKLSFLFLDLDPHNINISDWDVSNCKDMEGMFRGCNNLNCDISKWKISKDCNIAGMLDDADIMWQDRKIPKWYKEYEKSQVEKYPKTHKFRNSFK